ncbi:MULTISPECIES: hypothetical protein [unclassified Actinoplanes]|uniref:hypothetical protein n=1 Tax=unclassified Actinoplanes TaxID=2626549 RepID=UPI00043A474F|nr:MULTISPECIES: hypothetical protein [unclassified Actinoplanes]
MSQDARLAGEMAASLERLRTLSDERQADLRRQQEATSPTTDAQKHRGRILDRRDDALDRRDDALDRRDGALDRRAKAVSRRDEALTRRERTLNDRQAEIEQRAEVLDKRERGDQRA